MRSVFLPLALVVVFVIVFVDPSTAQMPKVAVYADADGSSCNIVDDVPAEFEVYVIVTDAVAGITSVQFAAPAPACMTGVTWLSDTNIYPVFIGDSQNGIAIAFGTCLSTPLHVLTIHYMGQGLTETCCGYSILPDPSVPEGEIVLTDCNFDILMGATMEHTVNGDASCPCQEAPFPPTNPTPPNGAQDQPTTVTLSWECSDPQGGSLTYDVYFGTDTSPSLVASDHPTNSYEVGPLNSSTNYYWRIVARDNQNNETVDPFGYSRQRTMILLNHQIHLRQTEPSTNQPR